MNRDSLKKNMLLKKENGNADMNGNEISEIKEKDNVQVFRVLAVEEEKVLVIDCIKKTMPVWMEIEKLDDFVEEKESNRSELEDIDLLEEYSPDMKKIIYQRYNIISAIRELLECLQDEDKIVLKLSISLQNNIDYDFDKAFSILFSWCKNALLRI